MKKAYSSHLVDHTIITFNFVIFSLFAVFKFMEINGVEIFSSFFSFVAVIFCEFYSFRALVQ